MNFADQRKEAAKQAEEILSEDKMPKNGVYDNDSDDNLKPNYMGENNSKTIDIEDSGFTIVNKPNGAYSKNHPMGKGSLASQIKYRKDK